MPLTVREQAAVPSAYDIDQHHRATTYTDLYQNVAGTWKTEGDTTCTKS